MKLLYEIIKENSFETKEIFRLLIEANKALAELKWVANTLPNKAILTNTLSLQEAKDSSAIENIITTHDELYKSDANSKYFATIAAKEVYSYAEALNKWYESVRKNKIISNKDILEIQERIEKNNAGFRKLSGTELKNDRTWDVVYIPPQSYDEIIYLMTDLEKFINNESLWMDPLICMALIHHQFESIHPFYDANGRTGRVLNILYLVKNWLLETPILYLSRYINQNKSNYYRLLQAVRDDDVWEEWILFILQWIYETSNHTINIVKWIKDLMLSHKHAIRNQLPKIYSQDLINNLFKHPYTKIDFIINDIGCTRKTAAKYLDKLTEIWILDKLKIGRDTYYINKELFKLLYNVSM